jgi:hypothetical protein
VIYYRHPITEAVLTATLAGRATLEEARARIAELVAEVLEEEI